MNILKSDLPIKKQQDLNYDFYYWGETPIIYNKILSTAYHYIDNQWIQMDKGDFEDYSEKISVGNKLFDKNILQEYQNYIDGVYQKLQIEQQINIQENYKLAQELIKKL